MERNMAMAMDMDMVIKQDGSKLYIIEGMYKQFNINSFTYLTIYKIY